MANLFIVQKTYYSFALEQSYHNYQQHITQVNQQSYSLLIDKSEVSESVKKSKFCICTELPKTSDQEESSTACEQIDAQPRF